MKADSGCHKCQNCDGIYTADELKDIKDLEQRISPGEIVPSGECPDCGALCHPITTTSCNEGTSKISL